MGLSWFSTRERQRRAAASWFVRMRGRDAAELEPAFQRWLSAGDNAAAYDRVARSYDAAALLRLSRPQAEADSPASARLQQRRFALAACLAAGLMVPAAWLLVDRGAFAPAPAMLMVSTSVGQVRTIDLGEGTTITLDTDSAVRYSADKGLRRAVVQRGRARFVRGKKTAPFEVRAGKVIIESGTGNFDVSVASGTVSVSSLEGIVRVTTGDLKKALGPGATVVAQGQSLAPSGATDPDWPSGMLEFDNEPLSSAAARANRYTLKPLLVREPAVARLRVTGAYRSGDVEGLASSLAAAFNLELVRLPGGELELRKKGPRAAPN